jgi:hypothetical protein
MGAFSHDGGCLPEGTASDKGADRLAIAITRLMGVPVEEYGTKKMTLRMAILQDISDILNPHDNPKAYKYCQVMLLDRGAVGPLVSLAQQGFNDAIRGKALETLVRVAFANERGATAFACDPNFPGMMGTLLATTAELPNRYTALQLAQAIAASSSEGSESAVVLRGLIGNIAAQILPQQCDFPILPRAAVEVLVSCSYHCPDAILEAVPWSLLASLVSECDARPQWLPIEPLTLLTCGLLATNLFKNSQDVTSSEVELDVQQFMVDRVLGGHFVEYFTLALEASVNRCEWPRGSGAFHSTARLLKTAQVLADHGHSGKLSSSIPHLIRLVEEDLDSSTTHSALRVLRSVCGDITCLDILLRLENFRGQTLEDMHKCGDETEATELLSFLSGAEAMLLLAQGAIEAAGTKCQNAPGVYSLVEIFTTLAPLDGELQGSEAAFQALCSVPILPAAAWAFATKASNLTFQSFAEAIYGTRHDSGLWFQNMEEVAAEWVCLGEVPRLPSFPAVVQLFDLSCKNGEKGAAGDILLEEVLPALHLPASGDAIEEAFSNIRGETLSFKSFALWVSQVCSRLANDELREREESLA